MFSYTCRLLDLFYFDTVAYFSARDTPTFWLGLEKLVWNFSLCNTTFGLQMILIVSLNKEVVTFYKTGLDQSYNLVKSYCRNCRWHG